MIGRRGQQMRLESYLVISHPEYATLSVEEDKLLPEHPKVTKSPPPVLNPNSPSFPLLPPAPPSHLAGGELAESPQRQFVVAADPVVVCSLGEGQRQHALLLQVGLVDPRERLDDNGAAAQVARLQSGVLARRSWRGGRGGRGTAFYRYSVR